ncbi:phosphodiester glycosidase family protein [Peribacillus saganii]|uniref:phosphodiester glycosidase family protein n=1 Tax=Peribacillus saganii TaxID=2303992 RepID=UPI00131485E4|nr:phosphodiester glycosidase family protein [Peribacillus saganii]
MKRYTKSIAFVLSFFVAALLFESSVLAAPINLTPGVQLNKTKPIVANKTQSVNILNVNLNDPYTTIDLGVASPLTKLTALTNLAKQHTYENHHVVGAVNASFFHFDTGNPSFLLARNNQIMNLGTGAEADTGFMHVPAAFGINEKGLGLIDRYNLNMSITHHNQTYTLSGVNRNREADESILYTSTWRYDNTRTNSTGMEIVVKNLSKNINSSVGFGESIEGKVASIRPYGQTTSATIPPDGYVISAAGLSVDQIRALKIGDPISLKIDVDAKWKNAKFILASGPLLVQGGKTNMTIAPTSPRATARTARTAVAIDSTGRKVFMVTVDIKSGVSGGMTMKEFADHLVKLGAYQAINLDGGGSTTMAARIPGDRYASLVNMPSGGSQRSISAILEAVSTAPYGAPVKISARKTTEGNIILGSSAQFEVTSALDNYNNLLPINNQNITLVADSRIGRIEGNKFIAEKVGTGNVIVKYGNVQAAVPVTVTSSVARLTASPSPLYIGKGKSQKITVNAYDAGGKSLAIDQGLINWSVQGSIGTIQNGIFTASAADGTGTLAAEFGGKKVSVPVTVSDKPVTIQSLDSTGGWRAESAKSKTAFSVIQNGTQKEGNGAVQLSYDFSGTGTGTSASYLVAPNRIAVPGQPMKIGVWVHGDGKKHWLRGKLFDAAGKAVTVDFTVPGGLNWYGWRYVEAAVPSNVTYPLSLERVYFAETVEVNKNKGSIYLDRLQAIYTDNHSERYFTASNPPAVAAEKEWTVKFNMEMNKASINNSTVYVEDETGTRQPVSVSVTSDLKAVKVSAPAEGYEAGKNYQLVITRHVASSKGKPMTKDVYKVFTVK